MPPAQRARRLGHQIVAVQGDVQGAMSDFGAGEFGDVDREPVGQCDTTGWDSQQHDSRCVGTIQSGLFNDLMRNTGNGATHIGRRHQFPRSAAESGVTRGTHARS
jgi:hypothetical protein